MRIYTSHHKPGRPVVLVREGFSLAACLFGFLYLLANGAFIASALDFAAWVAVQAVVRLGHLPGAPLLGLAVLQGLFGRDLVRWDLGLRGYAQGPVVAARDGDEALLRLLGAAPELGGLAV